MSRKVDDKFTDQLFKAILLLKDEKECYDFFRDIATVGEIKALGQRLEVARMLKEGYTYDQIVEETGVSTATISRVKRSLEYGEDGYNLILARLNKNNEN
ncbi:YerC/YecD family TrpR-related protein [Halanaerobium hydrogeniformans]|uniref:TrpR like protein, YerC/YecD n=1 Tax=Halanaerobium hydrogeniformans TaxID=656519 RepID=E4RJ46_HALHG|nr:YerC/YecD family TrpR-related protein [Halanaerobium hydrogeniformans]ADQ15266.1 TrpR like protein, YerC/YecD [Halanaerobium hydrogeniformans]